MHQPRQPAQPHQGFILLLGAIVILGSILRFLFLDQKLFWHDEVVTAARLSGYTLPEILAHLYDGKVHSVADVQQYQQLHPHRGVTDVIQSLVVEDSHHPPLYYVLLQCWARAWGDTVSTLRSLSAVFGVMALPAVYWLCLELFALPLVGWVAMAMMAVSPFHVLYAQEAREYSLWLLMMLLATAALMRAIRVNHWQAWLGYALGLTLSFYTHLFSLFVALGHSLSVFLTLGARGQRGLQPYAVAAGSSLLLLSPWLWVLIQKLDGVQASTDWTQNEISLMKLVQVWGRNISCLFVDGLWDGQGDAIAILFFCASIYALLVCCRQTPKQVWLLLILLMGVIPMGLGGADLIGGGMRSAIARYFVPSYIGLGLVWAYLLSSRIGQTRGHQQRLWQGITLLLLTLGLISCLQVLPTQISWTKGMGSEHPSTAALINQVTRPLLISSDESVLPADFVSLTYFLDLKVKLQLVQEPNIPRLSSGFSHIFVLKPSAQLRADLLQTDQTRLVQITESLWELRGAT